MQIFKDFD